MITARCVFQLVDPADPLHKQCSTCGRRLRTPSPPERCHARCRAPHFDGAGTRLKRMFRGGPMHGLLLRAGLAADPCRKCKQLAARMDRLGVAWCEQHVDEIVREIEANAAELGVLFEEHIVRWLVRRAIRQARKAQLDARRVRNSATAASVPASRAAAASSASAAGTAIQAGQSFAPEIVTVKDARGTSPHSQ